ncbi:hypothetical protein BH23VER1_BH23VER1_22750 [soil metagenome]
MNPRFLSSVLAFVALGALAPAPSSGAEFVLCMQSRDRESGQLAQSGERWDATRSALIICDMWDSHHSGYAARRTAELAPRIDALARAVRDAGGLVIHAPSDTMAHYEGSPARARAEAAPAAPDLPEDIGSWCYWGDDEEEAAGYPIDHSDGGEDDAPDDKAAWMETLAAEGRDLKHPWLRQIASISIDPERDAVTDKGDEVWNLLHARGIDDVMLAGVHTNMCVLGRPFGLRRLAGGGKNVVLVRDLTDTMYNPAMRPFVSHFRGTDLVVAHIEKHVCPTITSDQVLGGRPFQFEGDTRRRMVAAIGEKEYETIRTVPSFLGTHLADAFVVDYALALEDDPNSFPEIRKLADADLFFVSVRRRALPEEQLKVVRDYVSAGGAVVGIRTSSHAFALRGDEPPAGHAIWPEFDAEILGGNYHNHHGNKLATTAHVPPGAPADHPVLAGIPRDTPFATGGSLYQTAPLAEGATLLLEGAAETVEQAEPVAWTHQSPAGGRVFYTSLGHVDDFDTAPFVKLLTNACLWAAGE